MRTCMQHSRAHSQARIQGKQKGNLELVDKQYLQVFQCMPSRCWLGQERNEAYEIVSQDD